MKKILFILLALIFLASCQQKPAGAEDDNTKISYYINAKPNTTYIYNGPAEKYADWNVYYDYIGDVKSQKRIVTNNEQFIEVLRAADGEYRLTYGLLYASGHADYREMPDNSDVILLKEPLKKGQSWVQSEMGENGIESTITGVDVTVTVPYGTFKALEVTTIYSSGTEVTDSEVNYYAKDIGLIKAVSLLQGEEVVTELVEIRENEEISGSLPVFFLSEQKDRMVYNTVDVKYSTNADNAALCGEVLAGYSQEGLGIDLSGVKLNSLSVDKTEIDGEEYRKVTADFSGGLAQALSSADDLTVQCIVNYVGYFSKAELVRIVSDGAEFQSALAEDGFIMVDYGDVVPVWQEEDAGYEEYEYEEEPAADTGGDSEEE